MEASISPSLKPTRRGLNPVVRLFSSIWFGISLLTLILGYACVASALPQVRGALEMTEMQIFRHWTFVTLVGLFATTMMTTTWRRIRWNVTNLGVLTVHSGLILLTVGSVVYFGTKVEGDVQLFSPKIQLVSMQPSGPITPVAQLLAESGSAWSGFVRETQQPVELRVLQTKGNGLTPVSEVTLQAKIGDKVASTSLSPDQPFQRVSAQLGVLFSPATEVGTFYDAELAALYVRTDAVRKDGPAPDAELLQALPHLPIHRERFLPGGPELHDTMGRPVRSKRIAPVIPGTQIPTAWFEDWRMPISVQSDKLPFDLEIIGYLPNVEPQFENALVPDPAAAADNPALRFTIEAEGRRHLDETLFGNDPRKSLTTTQLPFEFVWVQSAAEAEQRLRELAGPNELTVELKSPPFEQTFAVMQGQTIRIPKVSVESSAETSPERKLGTNEYELTIQGVIPNWPLVTPPFENAMSPVARVQVRNGQQEFNRTVIQRFPQLSQDIDAAGTRHKESLDPNLVLTFRSSATGYAYFIAGPDFPLTFALFGPDGKRTRSQVQVGKPIDVRVRDGQVRLTVAAFEQKATAVLQPVVTAFEHQRPTARRERAAIRLVARGRGDHASWSETHWLFHSSYPRAESRPAELPLRYPGDGKTYSLIFSRMERDLRATLANRKLSVVYQPGQMQVDRWRSDFNYLTRDGRTGQAMVETNATDSVAGWTFFQSQAPRQDEWAWTVLGLGNRNGIWPMLLGCCLIPLGSMYAFYVKPWLIRRRQRRALDNVVSRETALSRDRTEAAEMVGTN